MAKYFIGAVALLMAACAKTPEKALTVQLLQCSAADGKAIACEEPDVSYKWCHYQVTSRDGAECPSAVDRALCLSMSEHETSCSAPPYFRFKDGRNCTLEVASLTRVPSSDCPTGASAISE